MEKCSNDIFFRDSQNGFAEFNHGSLFSGIGGFDLAAEWMGWNNIFHCEWNPFGQKILKHYWPKAISYDDITKTDFTIHRGNIDILTGGFPCQPYSLAGKRLGKEDDRHLWPEMLRAIREIQPKYIVGENVPGLINWNGGMVFEEVQAEMETEGYEVKSFVLPACGINAPHKRERIWFVANCTSKQSTRKTFTKFSKEEQGELRGMGFKENVPNSNIFRQEGQRGAKKQMYSKENRDWKEYRTFNDDRWESISPVCRGDYGISRELSEECLEALGNAIVPQVAYQIFKALIITENQSGEEKNIIAE